MGTVVLLPQDCLPLSKSRQKPNFTDVLYQSSSSTRTRGGTSHTLDPHAFYVDQSRQRFNSNRRVGWGAVPGSIPLPEHGQALIKSTFLQRESDGKKPKVRKFMEARDAKVASKPGTDVPAFTILQRPKDKELAKELIAKFLVKVDESKSSVGLLDTKVDVKVKEGKLGNGIQNAHLKKRISGPAAERSKFQSSKLDATKLLGMIPVTKVNLQTTTDLKEDRTKFYAAAPVSSKPVSGAKRDGHNRFDDLLLAAKGLNQMLCPKVSGEHKSLQTSGAAENFSYKLAHVSRLARGKNVLEGDAARLNRALTDPGIGKHVVGQHRSAVVEIPRLDTRSMQGITRSSSMSCPERWAGPAYAASPAPSSLPLPKFSRVNQKLSSSDLISPPVEGCNKKVPQLPESGSGGASPGGLQGGELDVASATRSLRRMLKLEPF